MTVEMAGSIRVARMSVIVMRPPRIGMRASAYPAGIANSRAMMVTSRPPGSC